MFEFIQAGGILMYPILLCSLVASAIIGERFWTLQHKQVLPDGLVAQVWEWIKQGKLDKSHIDSLRNGSPLGRILAAGLINRQRSREIMKESIDEVASHVVHDLERYLNMLGIIASITPLLGLLGTVVGMIEVFATITTQGVGDAAALAGGISKALFTTAAGLSVAIPAMFFYRYLRGKINALVVNMEQEALKMLDVLQMAKQRAAMNQDNKIPRVS